MPNKKPLRKKRRRKPEAEYELQDLDVKKVDLVGSPATGDRFLVVRSDGGEEDPHEATTLPPIPPVTPADALSGPVDRPADPPVDPEDEPVDAPQGEDGKPGDVGGEAPDDDEILRKEAEAMLAAEPEALGLAPLFREEAITTLKGILRGAMGVLQTVQDLPMVDDGSLVLPESVLSTLHNLGVEVARALVTTGVGEIEPDEIVWRSIERAGAKMKSTRLQRFRDAMKALTKVLEELEKTKTEREKMPKENAERNAGETPEPQTAPQTAPTPEVTAAPEGTAAPEATAAPAPEATAVPAAPAAPEAIAAPTAVPTAAAPAAAPTAQADRTDEPTLKDMMTKLDEIQRGQVDTTTEVKEVKEKMAGLEGRISTMEQATKGTNQQPEEDTGAVERSQKKSGFWGNVTGMAPPDRPA